MPVQSLINGLVGVGVNARTTWYYPLILLLLARSLARSTKLEVALRRIRTHHQETSDTSSVFGSKVRGQEVERGVKDVRKSIKWSGH